MAELRVDRISALPESLLHHIMSFLSLKEIIQVSSLSQSLVTAWKTILDLEFDEEDLIPGYFYCRSKVKETFTCLEQIMKNRLKEGTSIRKFSVSVRDTTLRDEIDRMVCYAIKSNVKELQLCLWNYKLLEILLCAKSINVLRLRGCKLESKRMSGVNLSSLTKLFLYYIAADSEGIQNLVAGCPLIEYLGMEHNDGFRRLELSGLTKLKEIMLDSNHGPEQVCINGANVQSVIITHTPISCEIDIASCTNLKFLNLSRVLVLDEWLRNQIPSLTSLEYLRLASCNLLERIMISSPTLKGLVIVTESISLTEVKIETPSLHIFKYIGPIRRISFSSNVLDLSEVVICDPKKFYRPKPESSCFRSIELPENPKAYNHGRVRLHNGKIHMEELEVKDLDSFNDKYWLVYFESSQINNFSSI